MNLWTISSDGQVHEFYSWKDVSEVWSLIKAVHPGDAILRRGPTVIDCA